MATQETRETCPFGLLGRTLAHSFSPRIHNELGSAPYALIEREPDKVEAFVREGDWRGLNVTIPYKRDAARLADELSERAARLGVANTLVRRTDGTIFADNTDLAGFAWMLERFCERELGRTATAALGGHKALILGTGGASEACRCALEDVGARVVRISRTGDETYATLVERHADAALVVNTTPVGTYPNCPASPLAPGVLEALTSLEGVLDVVYNPERTGLMIEAERLGLPHESGLAMLVAQALFSSELFQDKSLDHGLVERIEADIRRDTRSIILIGMPCSGKTSCGRRLARMCGRPFVDLDDSFEVEHQISPADCIHTQGEDAFRALETEVARAVCSRSGLVVATGGGVVTRPENYPILHQNATIVMLDRPLGELSSDNRPLSLTKGIAQLASERMGLYRSWADIILECTGSAAGDAVAIRQILGI